MLASVHEDLTPDMGAAFIDDENPFLVVQLNDFCRKRSAHRSWSAWRKAKTFGIVLSLIERMVVIDGCSPWLKRDERFVWRAATLAPIEVFRCIGREAREVLDRR